MLLFALPLLGWGQSDLSKEEGKDLKKLKEELEGTYQIEVIGSREEVAIHLKDFQAIHEKRKEQELAYHSLKENIRVRILPREEIEKSSFEGVDKKVVYIEEKKKDK